MDLVHGAAVYVHVSLHVSALSDIGIVDTAVIEASGHPEHAVAHADLAKREEAVDDHGLHHFVAYCCVP